MDTFNAVRNSMNRITVEIRNPLPFFVYGTLRPGQGNYAWSLAGRTTSEVTGFLAGASMYSNGGFPYVIERTGDKGVYGTLVDVAPEYQESMMEALDGLEGTNWGEEIPNISKMDDRNHYNRVTRLIKTDHNTFIKAWVYLPPRRDQDSIVDRLDHVPSGDWLNRTTSQFTRRLYGDYSAVSYETPGVSPVTREERETLQTLYASL